jgi:hypothetical protein
LTRSVAFSIIFENELGKRRSELALSKVEGVNLEPIGLSSGRRQALVLLS